MKQKLEKKIPSETEVLDPKCKHPMRLRLCDYYQWRRDNTANGGNFGTPGYKKLKGLFKAHFAWEREVTALEQYKKSKELTFNQEIDSPVKLKNEHAKVTGAVPEEERDPNTRYHKNGTKLVCTVCKDNHMSSECPTLSITCKFCGENGHEDKLDAKNQWSCPAHFAERATVNAERRARGVQKDRDSTKRHSATGCRRCGRTGHVEDDCYYKSRKCLNCGKDGHSQAVCKAPRQERTRSNTPNGSVFSHNGTKTTPRGTVYSPRGSKMSSPGGTRYKTYTPNGGHYSPRGSRYSRDGTKVNSPNGTNLRHRPDNGSRTAAFVRTDGRVRSPGGREYRNHSPGRYNNEPARPRSPQQSTQRSPSPRPASKDSGKSSVGSTSSTISKHRDGAWKLCKALSGRTLCPR